MKRHEAIQELIDETMDGFDVQRCISVMSYLGWGWKTPEGNETEVPTEREFRSKLRGHIKEALENEGVYSGGILVQAIDSMDCETGMPFVRLRASFVLESNFVLDGVLYDPEEEDIRFRVVDDEETSGSYSVFDSVNGTRVASGIKDQSSAWIICNIYRKDARDAGRK